MTQEPSANTEPDMSEAVLTDSADNPERYIGNLLLPVIVLLLAIVCFVQTFEFPDAGEDVGPASVPYLWIAFTAFFCVVLIVQAVRRTMEPDPKPGRIGFVIVFTLWLVIYLAAIETVGYFVSTFMFLVVSMYVLGYRNYLVMLGISMVWLVFAYFVYARLLYIPLPVGPLLNWAIG
jgi:putative tricarboxylic transport membrane protein